MTNPYSDIFNDSPKEEKSYELKPPQQEEEETPARESLDEILHHIHTFKQEAEAFSQLLSQSRVIEHKVSNPFLRLFIQGEDKFDQSNLQKERKYHELLKAKFVSIIDPMRGLAELHLKTAKRFNSDIDKDYYSIEKTDRAVALDKDTAIDGINLQRKILADGASNLTILSDGLADSERRIKTYINVGGVDNISLSEYELLVQKRLSLTNGQDHQFNYAIFETNLLDQTAISLGLYMKETSTQYVNKILTAFDFA